MRIFQLRKLLMLLWINSSKFVGLLCFHYRNGRSLGISSFWLHPKTWSLNCLLPLKCCRRHHLFICLRYIFNENRSSVNFAWVKF